MNGARPPKPRLALALGVVGHRPDRLPATARPAVAAQIEAVLDALSRAVAAAGAADAEFFAPGPPLLSLVSALAEGADRLAAEAALDHGFVLDAPLPFDPDTYEADFEGPESRAAFRRLLGRARSVLVLPGRRTAAPRAYEAAGLVLLGQSDILLAVWDGGPSAGRGGTVEMMATAARSGLPIIHVDARGEAPPRLLWRDPERLALGAQAVEDLPALPLEPHLPALVARLIRPPAQEAERAALRLYLNERPRRTNRRLEFPLLLWLLRLRRLRRGDLHPALPDALAAEFAGLAAPVARLDPAGGLAAAYGWADAAGVFFAQAFRGAYVANFVLAAAAVVVAAASLLASRTQLFVAAEIGLVLLVLVNTAVGQWLRWHRRWLEARETAERLRAALLQWTLGLRPPAFAAEEPAWTGWYARAVVRAQGLRAGVLDGGGLDRARMALRAVLVHQCDYHGANAGRMRKAAARLEWCGAVLVAATILGGLAELAGHHLPFHLDPTLVTALSAALPAVATATYGIRVIGDFEGVAARSERTHERLAALIAALERDETDLALLAARVRLAAEAMLGDVASWRLAAESRALAIPG